MYVNDLTLSATASAAWAVELLFGEAFEKEPHPPDGPGVRGVSSSKPL